MLGALYYFALFMLTVGGSVAIWQTCEALEQVTRYFKLKADLLEQQVKQEGTD
jgi:hypothetical protein